MLKSLSEDLKKIMLAGVGAVALTTEKSIELIDELVKKGEVTVEHGKELNEELKRNIKTKVQESINDTLTTKEEESIINKLETLDEDELKAIKEKINKIQKEKELQAKIINDGI